MLKINEARYFVMVNNSYFRQLALSFPGTVELPHFEKTSFRINKKIFATLDTANQRACIKLSPVDQSVFCAFGKAIIYPVNNKWGQQGWTLVELTIIKKNMLKDITATAYKEITLSKTVKRNSLKHS